MRAAHDAVLVGVGTVLADDPLLTARTVPLPTRQPARIVADSRLRTPAASRLVQSSGAGTVILAHGDRVDAGAMSLPAGVATWQVGSGAADGRVSPCELLRRARAEGLDRIFLEGGGRLAASFIRAGLIDRIEWFRAPILIGGDGLPAIAALGMDKMEQARRWKRVHSEEIGDDVLEGWEKA